MKTRLPIWARRLTVAHASLKDQASPAQVAKHMQRVVKKVGPHLIATTEAQKGDTRATRDLLGPEYHAARAGGRMAVWKRGRLRLMSEPQWIRLTFVYSEAEAWRDLWIAIFEFEDLANGLRYRVIIPHFAAGVEYGNGWKPQNVKGRQVHEKGWPRVRDVAAQAVRDGFIPIVMGDSNLNSLRLFWQNYIQDRLGTVRSVWSDHRSKKGSHGGRPGRLIDLIASTLPSTKAWVARLKRWKPMDHDVVVAVFNLTPAIAALIRKKK